MNTPNHFPGGKAKTPILLLLGAALVASSWGALAATVDDFTVPMGPITVGPGEVPDESVATMFEPSVLGGFRVLGPVVDDEAPPGNQATTSIGGGAFECDHSANSFGGGCTVAWTSDESGNSFDFTQAGAFEFEVLEIDSPAAIGVLLIGDDVDVSTLFGETPDGAAFVLEVTAPGVYSLPLDQFFDISNPFAPFDFSTVTVVALAVAMEGPQSGTVRIGPVSTTGPIGAGPQVDPPDNDPPPDEELINFVSGTYFNPARDGEGCQVTLEGDGVTIILTCYLFQDGAQAWIIGAGTLLNGQVVFDMTLTSGADFGNDFNAGDVVRTPWGTAVMRWSDCNTAEIELNSALPGYAPITLVTTKVTRNNCDGPGPDAALLGNQGTLFDPLRDGEGFQLALQGETGLYVLTWYTYLNGEQVWLIGTGTQSGAQLVFDDLVITSGADFGADFDADDVERVFWGSVIFQFTDCNNAIAFVTPMNGQEAMFDQFEIQVRKLVTGICG